MPDSVSEKVRPRLTVESSLPNAVPGVVSMSCQLLPPPLGNFQPRMSPKSAQVRVAWPVKSPRNSPQYVRELSLRIFSAKRFAGSRIA